MSKKKKTWLTQICIQIYREFVKKKTLPLKAAKKKKNLTPKKKRKKNLTRPKLPPPPWSLMVRP